MKRLTQLYRAAVFLFVIVGPVSRGYAGTAITSDFSSATLHSGLQDVDAAYTISGGTISKTTFTGQDERSYIRTVDSDYFAAANDFVYEVSFTNPIEGGVDRGTIQFIGIGAGEPSVDNFNEPGNGSLNFRIASPDIGGGPVDWAYNFELGAPAPNGPTPIGNITSVGTHRARISSLGDVLTFAIDENYTGSFMPSFSTTIDLADYPEILAALNTESRLFFGTAETTVAYDDFSVLVIPEGDYNQNGVVDAADYVVWRKSGGSSDDYNTWRGNFGRTFFTGSGAAPLPGDSPAVPEPSTLALTAAAFGLCIARRRHRANILVPLGGSFWKCLPLPAEAAPVVAWSPDHATPATAGLTSYAKQETFGRILCGIRRPAHNQD